LNILFVADVSISTVIGGAERVLYEQSTRLVRRGYDVHIMTRYLPGHQGFQEQINGVKEWRYEIDQNSAASYLKSTRQNSRMLFESLQRRHQFDVIVFQQPFSAQGIARSPLGRNIRKLYVCHSLSFEEFISRNYKPERLKERFFYELNVFLRRCLEKRVLKDSDKIIALSRYTIDKLDPAYGIPSRKYAIIPGGVDLDRFRPLVNKAEVKKKLGLPEKDIVLFTVRNLVPRMGLENLVEAVSIVHREFPGICLVIGGSGPLRKELEVRSEALGVQDLIRFEGFIPEEALPDYYGMADLFILPTRELEGFGLVTLEAMASGVPVLGTPVGGTLEILGRFDQGFLFKDTTPGAIAGLIREKCGLIRQDPEAWLELSQKCRRFVEETYSWEKHVDRLETFFSPIEARTKERQ